MSDRLQRLRERTNGYTVTPQQYAYTAYVALGALTLIVLSGAAVRLTGSGLGCPDWPKCYGNAYPPLTTHAVIEFSNRMITAPVSLAAGAAWLFALRRRPYRRDLMWLGALLPLGVIGQAVLGGFTVRGALDYGWVMGHFALSMLILLAAALLAWRAGEPAGRRAEAGEARRERRATLARLRRRARCRSPARLVGVGAPAADRRLILSLRWLVALGALTIFAGTAATAAGPHAGGSPGQRINRLNFDGRGTMDFVIHRHGEIALAFGLAARGGLVDGAAQARSAAGAALADGAVRAAGAAGGGGPGSIRDAPADGARVGARGAGLRRLAGRRSGRPAPPARWPPQRTPTRPRAPANDAAGAAGEPLAVGHGAEFPGN